MRHASILFLFISVVASFCAAEQRTSHSLGHDPMRAGGGIGYAQGLGSYVTAEYRYGLHDFLDPLMGYPAHTELELLSARVRLLLDQSRFWLDELTIARIASFVPLEVYAPELSWEVGLGARTERDTLCDHCIAGGVRAGLGAAWQPARSVPIEAFVLADLDVSYAPAYRGWPVKPGIGPHFGFRFRPTPWLLGMLECTYLYKFTADAPSSYDFGTEWRWSLFHDFALNARVHRYLDAWEWSGGLLSYF